MRLPFNALSVSQRERLHACLSGRGVPDPVGTQTQTLGAASILPGMGIVAGGIGLLVLSWWGYGDVYDAVFQGPVWLIGYLCCTGVIFASVAAIAYELNLRKRLPWTPGTYLFATDLIDAGTEDLAIHRMNALVDFSGTHHSTNGVYQHTTFTFTFETGAHSMVVASQALAETILRDLQHQQTMLQAAIGAIEHDEGARDLLFSLDPLIEARLDPARPLDQVYTEPVPPPAEGITVPMAPGWVRSRWIAAAFAAVVVGGAWWAARNVGSDVAGAQRASDAAEHGNVWVVESYIDNGWLQVGEAERVWLPRARFEQAAQDGSATAYRTFLNDFGESVHAEDARTRLAALYDETLAAFASQASQDERVLPLMTALVKWLQAHDASEVQVRFLHPDSEMLAEVDAEISKSGGSFKGIPVAPVAPSFTAVTNRSRQATITKSLNDGFRRVFPADILTLTEGPPLEAGEGTVATVPTIGVRYGLGASGAVYSGDAEDRLYVGITVPFFVSIEVPGHPDKLEFLIEVEPPEQFSTYSSSDSSIYDVMARVAFEQLANKLRAAFFEDPGIDAPDSLTELERLQQQIDAALRGR